VLSNSRLSRAENTFRSLLDLSESSKKVPLSLTATAQFHSQMYQAYKALD
jgi:hypothetical protein